MKSIKEGMKKYGYPATLLLLMVIAGCLVRPVFYLNDDVTMRSILSGAYTGTPDGHAVYMQYPLSWILAMLYRVLPIFPWMEVFFAGCIWMCMVLVTNAFGKKWLGAIFSLVAFLPFFLYLHYTLVAALVAATAIFLLCKGKPSLGILLLLWISFMIRSQVGLLCLPFVVAAGVWQLLCQDAISGQKLKKLASFSAMLLVGILLIAGINRLCYANADWQEYLQYNEARTRLYDYTDFLSTDKYEKEYADYGMSAEEYELLFYYNTMLENRPDSEKLQAIAHRIEEGMETESGLKAVVNKYYIQLRYHDAPYNVIWLVAFGFLGFYFLFQRKWLQVLYLGLLAVGRSSIWMYLLWQGRFPERVSVSLYLLELLLLLGIGLSGVDIKKQVLRKGFVAGVAVLLLLLGVYLGKDTIQKVEAQIEIQQEWDVLKKYSRTNHHTTYLVDVFSAVKYGDVLFSRDNDNIMLLGGWLTTSPLTQERLVALGGQDASEVLYTNRDVRLVVASGKDLSWMEDYFKRRFPDSRLVQEMELSLEDGGFRIYRLDK